MFPSFPYQRREILCWWCFNKLSCFRAVLDYFNALFIKEEGKKNYSKLRLSYLFKTLCMCSILQLSSLALLSTKSVVIQGITCMHISTNSHLSNIWWNGTIFLGEPFLPDQKGYVIHEHFFFAGLVFLTDHCCSWYCIVPGEPNLCRGQVWHEDV